jgi:phospholipase/lecithinase/hemolysin
MRIRTQRGTKRELLLTALLACGLAAPVATWAQGPVPGIVFFGDSLSDSGNAFALQRENNTPPAYSVDALLVPDDAYARGGHHFTNGPTWAELLAKSMGVAADADPAFRSSDPRAADYAVGGARAYDDGQNFDLPLQVEDFLEDVGGNAPSGALYVIEIGGNDVRDALGALGAGQDPAPFIAAGVGAVGANIAALYQAGARRFLVWNVANSGLTPAVQALGPASVFAAGQLSQAFNTNLDGVLATLATLPGITIIPFDLYGTFNAIYANPASFGLTDFVDPCISPNDPPFVCRTPDQYLFWDGIHPTEAVHTIIARDVAALLPK